MPRFGPIALREETLQRANRDRLVDRPAPAGGFAGVRAHAAAYAGHRIRVPRVAISLLKTPLGNQRHVAAGVGSRRTSHHAREVAVQPFPVDFLILKPIQHSGLSPRLAVFTWIG